MILGMGIDLCQTHRFLRYLDKERFLHTIFHAQELADLQTILSIAEKSRYLAGRWAAKESFIKALGMGIFTLPLPHMWVQKNNGAPCWCIEPDIQAILNTKKISSTFLSLSYEKDIVVALTILEGGPA